MMTLTPPFIASLHDKYASSLPADKWESAWQAEQSPLQAQLTAIGGEIAKMYMFDTPLGVGGSGVTILLTQADDPDKKPSSSFLDLL